MAEMPIINTEKINELPDTGKVFVNDGEDIKQIEKSAFLSGVVEMIQNTNQEIEDIKTLNHIGKNIESILDEINGEVV